MDGGRPRPAGRTRRLTLFNFGRFIQRRGAADAGLLLGAGLAVLIAMVVIGGAPAYLRSLELVGVGGVLDGLTPVARNLLLTNDAVPSRLSAADGIGDALDDAAASAFGDVAGPSRRAFRSPYHRNTDPLTITRWSLARFVLMDGFEDHVSFVEGRPPEPRAGPAFEAALPAGPARELGIAPGQTITLRTVRGEGPAVEVLVTGVFEPLDEGGRFWMGLAEPLLRPAVLPGFGGGAAGLFVSRDTFSAVMGASAATPMSAAWIVDLDQDALARLEDGRIVRAVESFESAVERAAPGTRLITGLERAMSALERRAVFARVPMFLMATILLTIVGYYLLMVATVLAARRRDEVSRLRSRGMSLPQIARLYGAEALVIVGVSAAAGPLLAVGIIRLAGLFPPFDGITGGEVLPATPGVEQYLSAGVAAIVILAILVAPSLLAGAGGRVVARREEGRPRGAPWFQRYFLDAAIFILAGLLVWELDARGGEVIRVDADGGLSADPTVFLAPALVLLGVSLAFLRVFPPAVRGIAVALGTLGPAWATLAAWRLSRAPFFYAPAVLLVTLAAGLAFVAATLAATLRDSADERVLYESGADIRVAGARDALALAGGLRGAPGVRNASAAMRTGGNVGTTSSGPGFELLAVETEAFADIAWWRDDFSELDLPGLMRLVSPARPLEPILLPEGSAAIGVWTQTDSDIEHLFLWVTVRGAGGIVDTLTLGPVERGGWRFQSVPIGRVKTPAELLSIKLFEPAGENRATAGSVLFDDVVAVDSRGSRTVVANFDEPGSWAAFPTSEGIDARFNRAAEPPGAGEAGGSGVGAFTFGRGVDAGVRGFFRSSSGGPLPVIVSSTVAESAGLVPGEPFVARAAGKLVLLVPVAVADYFPTLDPDRGSGFMVTGLERLVEFLEIKGAFPSEKVSEVFVGVTPGLDEAAVAEVRSRVPPAARVELRSEMSEMSLVDPLSVAGWRGVGALAGVTTVIVVILGYATYLRAYSGRMYTEEAFVRSLGFSRANYAAAAVVEHLLLAGAGIVVGALAGLAMSGLAVDVSVRTDSGAEPLPPFILATRWGPLAAGFGLLVAAAVAAVAFLTVRYGARRLHEATRAET